MLTRSLRCFFAASLMATLAGTIASPAWAVITNDPTLPPSVGVYTSPETQQYDAPGFSSTLYNIQFDPTGSFVRMNAGADETQTYDATLTGTSDVSVAGLGVFPGVPISASGSVLSIALGKVGITTGTFTTEMLAMNLTGNTPLGPFMIRESPTLASTGVVTITDLGGGRYNIDSFFDVFTELSIDGGQNFIPDSQGPTRLTLVPEPSTLILALLGAGAAIALRRRRR